MEYLANHVEVWDEILIFSVCSAIGQIFIFYTGFTFDSLATTTITTTRKLFTILLSVVVYNHALGWNGWAGIGLVFSGLTLEAALKIIDKRAKAAKHTKEA